MTSALFIYRKVLVPDTAAIASNVPNVLKDTQPETNMILDNMNHTDRYTLYGAAFGVCFPVLSTFFDSWIMFGSVGVPYLIQAQTNQPLLWVIDSAPVFLGLFARMGGKHYDKLKVSEEEREKLMQVLQQDNDELEDKIAARTDELRHSMELAQQATRVKSEFLATISHELRTPMNGVLGMGQLLKGTTLDETQKQYVDIVLKSGGNLLTIIDDMLDFSRLENKQLELSIVPMDLKAAVKDACAAIEKKCREKSLELIYEFPDTVAHYVLGDAVRVHQVLMNLLDNAVKYTEKGEIRVAVTCPAQGTRQASYMISVSDTGQGIQPELMKSLFNGFTRGDSGTSRKHGGMGLGLAISKQLVRQMGGEIGVNSEVGKGSTFWISVRFDLVEDAGSDGMTIKPKNKTSQQ